MKVQGIMYIPTQPHQCMAIGGSELRVTDIYCRMVLQMVSLSLVLVPPPDKTVNRTHPLLMTTPIRRETPVIEDFLR